MAFRKLYQINLESLFQNGTSCSNPTITWEKPDCINIRCELENGTVLKVEVPEDCDDGCIYVNIDCGAECGECEPHRLKICPCDTNNDCEECEKCVDNICVTKCPEGQFCSDDKCVECDDENPCDCNKVCVAGQCVCPANLPFEDDRGCCHDCADNGDCDICEYCTPDGCVPKECLCDPLTGNCVECYNSGHCTGPNECCVNNECDCCPGFKRNPDNGLCEPAGCETDGDCGPCSVCVDGDCVQLTCPEGYVFTGGTPCCSRKCNCDEPDCPTGQDCVRLNNVDCYCTECSGTCDNDNDCEVGCECDEATSNCVKKGCDGPCETAQDCAPDCGCFENECVPCSELTCEQCRLVSGCTCIDNVTCVASPCDSPCSSADDCEYGCGCDDDGECKQCDNIPCESQLDCPYGCYCDLGISKCKPNPCADFCVSGNDCKDGCKCAEDRCIPCDPSDPDCDGGDDDCTDVLSIIANDDCTITGQLVSESCCGCDTIGVDFEISSYANVGGTATYKVDSRLRLGEFADIPSFEALPKLSETGVVNELPNQGALRYRLEIEYSRVSANGTFIPGGDGFTVIVEDTEDYTGSDTEQFDLSHQMPGAMHVNGTHKVLRVAVYVESTINFEYPNECVYHVPKTLLYTITSTNPVGNGTQNAIEMNQSVFCRLPLFTWYKDNTTGDLFDETSIFREVYATRVDATTYRDVLETAPEVEVCLYYGLKTPCGCDNQDVYNCNNLESPPNKLIFCSPSDIEVLSLDSCNNSIKIKEVDVCDAMADSTYTLYINGVVYNTYTVTNGKLFEGDVTITLAANESVTEVKLEFECDDCDKCTIIKTLNLIEPCACAASELAVALGDHDCATGFTYSVTGGIAPYDILIVFVDSNNNSHNHMQTDVASGTVVGPINNGQFIIKVTDAKGCIKEYNKVVEDCCVFDVINASYSCDTQKVSIVFSSPVTNPTATIGATTVNVISGVADFGALVNGTYNMTVVDAEGCPKVISLNVNCCDAVNIDSIVSVDCQTLTVTLSGAGAAGVDEYRIDNMGAWTAFVPPTIVLGAPLTTGTHTVSVRDASFPACVEEAAYDCNSCPVYSIGGSLTLDCTNSRLTITGIIVPSNDNNCSVFAYAIYKNGSLTPIKTGTTAWASWAGTMYFPITNIGNGGTYRVVIVDCESCVVFDDSVIDTPLVLDVSYDCSTYLDYTTSPGGATLTYECSSGCSPAIPAGTAAPVVGTQLTNGTYIFTLTLGGCVTTKTLVVGCGGGGVDPDCPLVDGVDFIVSQVGCNFSIVNNAPDTLTVYLETLNNLPSTCTGTVIKTVTLGNISTGSSVAGSILYNGYAHRLRITYPSSNPGDPSPCEVIHCLAACAGSGTCTVDPLAVCVQDRFGSAKLKVTNINTNAPVVLFIERTSATSFNYGNVIVAPGASWLTTISQDAALPNNVGTYHIKAVCVYDQTIFWEVTYSGLAQIPDC